MPQRQEQKRDALQCDVCCLHYDTEELARKCHDWCSTHVTCNIEIIKHAKENKTE